MIYNVIELKEKRARRDQRKKELKARLDENKELLKKMEAELDGKPKDSADLEKINAEIERIDAESEEYRKLEEESYGLFLGDIFRYRQRDELEKMAQSLDMEDFENLDDSELADAVADKVLDTENMEKSLILCTDEQDQLMEKMIDAGEDGYRLSSDEEENFTMLNFLEFAFRRKGSGVVDVPLDVAEAFRCIDRGHLAHMREGAEWMYDCIQWAMAYYGVMNWSVVYQLFGVNESLDFTKEEIRYLFNAMPEFINPFVVEGARIVEADLLDDDLYLDVEAQQGDKSFYIPTIDEMRTFAEYSYPRNDPAVIRMKEMLKELFHLGEGKALELTKDLWSGVVSNWQMSQFSKWLQEKHLEFDSEADARKLIDEYIYLDNNTRIMMDRGHKPAELNEWRMPPMPDEAEGMPIGGSKKGSGPANLAEFTAPAMSGPGDLAKMPGVASAADVIGSGSGNKPQPGTQHKKIKVGRNDPCPCGSGKKYKYCHGRNA
jgi:hypothetical protein